MERSARTRRGPGGDEGSGDWRSEGSARRSARSGATRKVREARRRSGRVARSRRLEEVQVDREVLAAVREVLGRPQGSWRTKAAGDPRGPERRAWPGWTAGIARSRRTTGQDLRSPRTVGWTARSQGPSRATSDLAPVVAHIVLFNPKLGLTTEQLGSFAQSIQDVTRRSRRFRRALVGKSGARRARRIPDRLGIRPMSSRPFWNSMASAELTRLPEHPSHRDLGRLFWEYCGSAVVMEAEFRTR